MKRHGRDNFFIVGEGVFSEDSPGNPQTPSTLAEIRKFRFSRLGPPGPVADDEQRQIAEKVGEAMDGGPGPDPDSADTPVPAGFTYLAQFVDHDLTADKTAVSLGQDVTVAELLQGRSPALDLDSLYGRGPQLEPQFYAADGVRLKTGTAKGVGFPANNPFANNDQDGFDLPRVGQGSSKAARRAPLIPDRRNDENLAVGQTHLMFVKFHNAVVDRLASSSPSALLFERARAEVVRHYQWVVRHDLLPRIIDPAVLEDVWTNGRQFFEVPCPYDLVGKGPYAARGYQQPGDTPTMPVEFSVAAYRLGHSLIRDAYEWNAVFSSGGPNAAPATLAQLFRFSGTSGNFTPGTSPTDVSDLTDPDSGVFEQLPSNWVADFRRLYDFAEIGREDLVAPNRQLNVTKRLDTLLVSPLKTLPLGAFADLDAHPVATGRALNLAFRNLVRAQMVRLASGQQMAAELKVDPLTADQILQGRDGASLVDLTEQQKTLLVESTPLWFYVLREAELGDGRLTGVGARIVAEVFHRAIEGSTYSIVRDSDWRPSFAAVKGGDFHMTDLLLFAVGGNASHLFPLG
jgi:hypothetical protein